MLTGYALSFTDNAFFILTVSCLPEKSRDELKYFRGRFYRGKGIIQYQEPVLQTQVDLGPRIAGYR